MKGIPKPLGDGGTFHLPKNPQAIPKPTGGAGGAVHLTQNHRGEGDQLVGLGECLHGGPWGKKSFRVTEEPSPCVPEEPSPGYVKRA